tara:strand:- start:1017 stop:1811 length:795 start_codon:yes stop_codon:yes gene_type:complete
MTKKIIIKYIYIIFCKLYQNIIGCYENIFLQKNRANESFKKKGILDIIDIDLDIKNDILDVEKKTINKYSYVRILDQEKINRLVKKVFTNEVKKIITQTTGFEYSIDYLIYYDRESIERADLNTGDGALSVLNQWYAYKWHFDKPNSTNMLKIILPISIENNESALAVLDRDQSISINPSNVDKFRNLNKNYFKGLLNNIYGFNPTVCIHRDGIPPKGTTATQIMFQLNPSKNWQLNKEIYKKQMKREPKFPLFSYFSDKKIKI